MNLENNLPVVVIGAGPVGMAAVAHLTKRNIPFLLFEAGNSVGSSILSWEHIRVFSPWKYNIDKVAKELLKKTNWAEPNENEIHTGGEFVEFYLKPLAELPQLKEFIFTNSSVISVGKKGLDKMKTNNRENTPFVIQVQQGNVVNTFETKAIIDASGTWFTPNPIGSGGSFAVGEIENSDRIFYGIPDVLLKHKMRFANKNVAVIGGGHSAINTILELEKIKEEFPKTEINWILRKQNISDVYGGKEEDTLEARGALGIKIETLVNDDKVNVYTPFQIQEVLKSNNKLSLIGKQNNKLAQIPNIDEIIANTGSRPDFSFLREVRLSISNSVESVETLAELIDPNIHSCGTVRAHGELELQHPDKNFYIVGSKSYGRAPTFLMATGYEQIRSIVAALDGDMEAARKVELDLPETGVCSSGIEGNSCCAVDNKEKDESACCG
ncbi:MAG: NAD(P)-binding domain-containing protein [Flavobacteriales bacterium]|nr:NAD(P)-binding domain-containing protein [Flavobacteriales bacterium]